MTTRLVRDELDLNLSSLTTTLLIIIVIIIASCRHARALGTAWVESVTTAKRVIVGGGMVHVRIRDVGHFGSRGRRIVMVVDGLLDMVLF